MLVFWKKNLVLFAVPKTGTTSLAAALAPNADAVIRNPPGLKHCNVTKYNRELRGFFERNGKRPMRKVAVVREPIDWLGSWYRYRARPQLQGHINSTSGISFDQFVEGYLSDTPPDHANVGSQAKFVGWEAGAHQMEHLFSYENLNEAVAFLSAELGLRIDLPKLNRSPKVALALSPSLVERLKAEKPEEFSLYSSL